MFEAWGWIDGEWVAGWDVGTLRKMTVFFVGDKPYTGRHYLQDYEVVYDKHKPSFTASDNLLLQQTLSVL